MSATMPTSPTSFEFELEDGPGALGLRGKRWHRVHHLVDVAADHVERR